MNSPARPDLLLTERLRLRRPLRADLPAFHDIHADPDANRFSRIGAHRSVEQSRAVLEAWLDHWETHGFGPWVMEERALPEGPPVGFAGLRWRGRDELPGLNLYFRLRQDAWGKGLATEAASRAIRFALVELGAPEVTAIIHPENQPSIRVAERVGMHRVRPVRFRGQPSVLYSTRAPPP